MLFNSFVYILLFLPVCAAVYFLLLGRGWLDPARLWLLGASLFFYSYWNVHYLPLIVGSIAVNYLIATAMGQRPQAGHPLLLLGLLFNLGLLGYYKYAGFLMTNLAELAGWEYTFQRVALPLAISFFTLQQVAFLVDSREGRARPGRLVDYATFVSFFPQLIAGPIVHHREVMPQFESLENKRVNWDNMAKGVAYFAVGLFKKVVVADTFARLADAGFAQPGHLSALESLAAILSYTFQLYYDFGGYMDMAIGAALLFNISLPINFNSPFKAPNIIDFWRRWHITLSNFITAYLYTPMVRAWAPFSFTKSMVAIFLTMAIAGLWHGAAWTFVIFGCIHGAGLVVNHLWRKRRLSMPAWAGVVLTFATTAVSLCFFRADSTGSALSMLAGLGGGRGIIPDLWLHGPHSLLLNIKQSALFSNMGSFDMGLGALITTLAAIWCFAMPNTHQMFSKFRPDRRMLVLCAVCLAVGFLYMNSFAEKEFLYFDF